MKKFELHWQSADKQSSIFDMDHVSERMAVDNAPVWLKELLAQCGTDEDRENILAGSFVVLNIVTGEKVRTFSAGNAYDRDVLAKRVEAARAELRRIGTLTEEASRDLLICVSAFGMKPSADERKYERERRETYLARVKWDEKALQDLKAAKAALVAYDDAQSRNLAA